MDGWVKLHRKLSDNPIWFSEKFTRGQAWVDLILLANHKDGYFYKRGVKINVKKGQVGRSEVELSDRWKWSRSKVRKFLKDLEKEQQIEQHKTNVTQVISILSWDKYQKKEQQTEQQKDTKRTPKEQQKDTYKNVKKEKNVNNDKNKHIEFNFKNSLLDLGIKKEIVDDWLKVRKTKKATNTETSFRSIKKQIELSGKIASECIRVAVENNWAGFKADWLKNLGLNNKSNGTTEERIRRLTELMNKNDEK